MLETPWWFGKTPPQFYSFDPETREWVGTGPQDPSPLEPDVWLVPGSATDVAPPTIGERTTAIWEPDLLTWFVVPDYRGEVRWHKGQFWTVDTFGEPPVKEMQVHDAQYVMGPHDTVPRIRMWINEAVIEFPDEPGELARKVLAAWEAKGETIRPVDFDFEAKEPDRPDPESEARRLAQLRGDLDKLAADAVEGGSPIPQEHDA